MKNKTNNVESKKEIKVDLNDLIRKTYNKIALWNNEDSNPTEKGDRLRFVSHEIVEDILTEAFSQLKGVKTKVRVEAGVEEVESKGEKKPKKKFFNLF